MYTFVRTRCLGRLLYGIEDADASRLHIDVLHLMIPKKVRAEECFLAPASVVLLSLLVCWILQGPFDLFVAAEVFS